jgi:Uma2 family endonuclease
MTAEEFARRPEPEDGSREELVRGEVVTMPPPNFRHGEIAVQIGFLLKSFLRQNPLGRVVGETGVRTEQGPDSVRGPDVSYWSFKRLPKSQRIATYPKVAADLCIEIRSPSNSPRKIRAKVAEYLRAGVRIVWVVDPRDESVTVYHRAGRGVILSDDEILDADDILPGFSCPVSQFFEV